MRHGRQFVAAAVVAPLALSLVAASTTGSGPRGAATTSLSAVELAVTTPDGGAELGVVDATTFAATATDTEANPKDVPFARALLTPLTGPDGPVGQVEARSDGPTSVDAAGSSLAGLGGPAAEVSGTVAPVTLTANASAERARAAIGALTAQVGGLADALGISLDASGVESEVTPEGASAVQGLRVSEVEVSLGDILPADVLARLPLPDLLALLESLPIELPADLQRLVSELRAGVDEVVAGIAAAGAAGDALDGALGELASAEADRATLSGLVEQRDTLLAVDLADPASGDALTGIGSTIDDLVGALPDPGEIPGTPPVGGGLLTTASNHTASCVDAAAITTPEALQAASDCVSAVIDAELAARGVTSLDGLQALIDDLVAEVTGLVDELVQTIENLAGVLGDLTTLSADLDDLLAALEGLLADAAGTPLFGVTAFDVGVTADSDGTLAGSDATILCEPVTVTVLSQSLTTPSCETGLSAVADATGLVGGLLAELTDTLNVLPLTEVLTTGDLRAELFTDLRSSVVEDGDAVVATAGVTVLDLAVPAITIDPGPVTGLLDQLGLPDVLGTVTGLLSDALADVEAAGLAGLDPATATLTEAAGTAGVAGTVGDLTAQLEALLAGVDLGALGTLDAVTTPSVSVVIDPVSTASFTAGAPVPPAGAPDTPSLPNTGGGLALLGLATLAGAAALRRR